MLHHNKKSNERCPLFDEKRVRDTCFKSYHHVFFFCPALGNHKRECHKRIVAYQLRAVGFI